ncbi:MAG: hypothetical protein EPN91_05505 [Salinibacterium sp.]|nr:MAG: hypothetical protein EPN91_05505 [Salinibacterium sp.]
MAQQERLTSYAADRARLLLGCYRTGDANDPDTYVAAISAILSRYPEEIITEVTHPATGLPSRSNWLPTVKEVADACEAAISWRREREAREERIRKQLQEREEFERARDARPTLEQLKAKYGPDWGITEHLMAKAPPVPAPTLDQLRHHYQHYDLAMKPKQEDAA